MKKGILLASTIILFAACFAQAQEGELTGTLDVTYRSAYTWYGIDRLYGGHGEGATETTLDLDLYGTGFGVSTKWVLPNSGKPGANSGSFVNAEELWLTLTYSGSCLEYETYATNYTVGWTYYDFPDQPSSLVDTQEVFASLSWPEICPAGIVPSYTIVRMWKSESGRPDSPTGALATTCPLRICYLIFQSKSFICPQQWSGTKVPVPQAHPPVSIPKAWTMICHILSLESQQISTSATILL